MDFHTFSELSRVIENLHQKMNMVKKIVLQLMIAKGSPTTLFTHRPSILYGLFRRWALLLLAFLPRRLNDVIDTQ